MLVALLMIALVFAATPVSAQTGHEESICLTSAVFNCENWADYPVGQISGDLPSHFKQGTWSWGGGGSIVNAIGPLGTTQNMLEYRYAPVTQGAGDSSAGSLATTLLQQRSDLYLRWYAKFVAYRWSVISTKHMEFTGPLPAGSTNVHLWSNHGDGSAGSPPVNTSDPVFQNQNSEFAPPEWRQNVNNPKVFEGPSVAGFANNIWYCLEAHVRYNSAGQANSIYEGWIQQVGVDAQPVLHLSYSTIQIANAQLVANSLLIATTWNCVGNGNGVCDPAGQPSDVHADMWRYTANIVVSSQRIGCLTGSSTPGTPANLTVTMNRLFNKIWAWLGARPAYAGR